MHKIGDSLVVDLPISEENIELFLKCTTRAIEQEKDFKKKIDLYGMLGCIEGMKKIFEVEKKLYFEKNPQ